MGTHDIIHPEPIPTGFSERSHVLMFSPDFSGIFLFTLRVWDWEESFINQAFCFLMSLLAFVPFTEFAEYQQASTLLLCHVPKNPEMTLPPNHSFVYSECDGSGTPISTVESQKSNYLERHFCRKQRAALGCGTFPYIPYHVLKLVCWKSIKLWWDMIVKPMAGDGAPMNSSWWNTVFWCLSSMIIYVHQIWFW